MLRLGAGELIVLLIIFLVVFGPSKLPAIRRTIGNALGEFKKAAKGMEAGQESEQES